MNTTNEDTTETAPATPYVFQIPRGNLRDMKEKLDKLIRRAEKLGCEPPSYKVGEMRLVCRIERDLDDTSYEVISEVYDVTVTGKAPSYNGWTFVAVRDHAEGGVPLIRAIDHEEIPVRFRDAGDNCEHCKLARFRKETFVLRHDDRIRWIQVGRSCIRDFLGHESPENIVAQAELIAELRDTGDWSDGEGFEHWSPSVERYVSFVACVIRLHGWMPRSKAGDPCMGGVEATANIASEWLTEAAVAAKKGEKSRFPLPTAEDRERAKGATAWAVSLSDEVVLKASGDFLHNVRAAAQRVIYTAKTSGILAAIIPAWDREMGFKRAERGTSAHVGAVGDRFKLTVKAATKKRAEVRTDTRLKLTVQSVRPFSSAYGENHMHTMIDEAGNVFVWWSGNVLETGGVYLVAGTVRKHDEFRGVKQTVLTRCEAERVEFDLELEGAQASEPAPAVEAPAAA